MTLIELLTLILCLAAGVFGAICGGARFGVPGYLGGFVVGIAALPISVFALTWIDERLFAGPSAYPPCGCGRIPDDLHIERGEVIQSVMYCACGARYLRRRGRVFRLEPGRALRAYMRWHPIRRWIPDTDAAAPPNDGPYR